MNRRSFMSLLSAAGLLLLKPVKTMAGVWERGYRKLWHKNIFTQDTVDISMLAQQRIAARVDGQWRQYALCALPDSFITWNLSSRRKSLSNMMNRTGGFELSGPHSGMVASYGAKRKDSLFSLNNAVKGMGLAPKQQYVKEWIAYMQAHMEDDPMQKLRWLLERYENADFFDFSCMTSLELYSTPSFETHTFLNVMANPVTTTVFLDNPSFEVRAITRIVHPEDTQASAYEKDLLQYVNLVHSFFHGHFSKIFPLLVFHVVEVFDNSPGKMRGVRQAPPLP